MTAVALVGLRKKFGPDTVLDDLSLNIEHGDFAVFTGTSKSGKSVLFRTLIGLESLDQGRVILEGVDITDLPAGQRRIGYVPQSFALYPHMSVRANIGYPMVLTGSPKSEVKHNVDRVAGMLSIEHLLDKMPVQLSGGEKQRTTLARGLLRQAQVFILDDPLVGLDFKLRERLMDDLKDLRKELGATFLYATADSIEALTLASTIFVLDQGRCIQSGTPEHIYRQPATPRVLELLGFPRANLVAGDQGWGRQLLNSLALNSVDEANVPLLGLRPEDIRLDLEPQADPSAQTGTVTLVEDLGSEIVVYLEVADTAVTVAFAVGAMAIPEIGDQVYVTVAPEAILVYDNGALEQRKPITQGVGVG